MEFKVKIVGKGTDLNFDELTQSMGYFQGGELTHSVIC